MFKLNWTFDLNFHLTRSSTLYIGSSHITFNHIQSPFFALCVPLFLPIFIFTTIFTAFDSSIFMTSCQNHLNLFSLIFSTIEAISIRYHLYSLSCILALLHFFTYLFLSSLDLFSIILSCLPPNILNQT